MIENVLIVDMGGTIGAEDHKLYSQGQAPKNVKCLKQSPILPTLKKIAHDNGISVDFVYESIPHGGPGKDSKDVTEDDLRELVNHIKKHKATKILIPFGTDAMIKNAKRLKDIMQEMQCDSSDKTILFVGAFIPLARPGSDGVENLKGALEILQKNEPLGRIAICIGKMVYAADQIVKNPIGYQRFLLINKDRFGLKELPDSPAFKMPSKL